MADIERLYVRWRNKYLRSYSGGGYYIFYNADCELDKCIMTCSEAHGYGMLISVLKRNQADFDGLLYYFEQFKNSKGLMQWQQKTGPHGRFVPSDEGGENCATDGDIDIAASLFLAARWFGNSHIDYRGKAIALCRAIHDHCINHQTWVPKIGDWTDPGTLHDNLTRCSDFILNHFNIFYHEDHERQQSWGRVMETIIRIVNEQLALHPTGLLPDFLEFKHGRFQAPQGEVLESKHDGCYNWNSCRVPWRLASYFLQTKDPRILPSLQAMCRFFAQQREVKAGYRLDGHALVDYTDMSFLAPVSFLFWVMGDPSLPRIQQQMNDLDEEKYFGQSIALINMLQAVSPY
ncbi:uncharacterized protein VTP21DRAFT_11599 [Calcarisporiella thermophila]|uniref:uncharacterized protein n=1 Tax=Calcarisporiella thermophila TaxID=911321 RepID=UPI003742E239